MNASKQLKNTEDIFWKNLNFQISKKKIDGLKAPWISEIFDTFLMELTQFEKTGSIGKIFMSLGNSITNSTCETQSRSHFSWYLHFHFSILEIAFLLTKEMMSWTWKQIQSHTAKKNFLKKNFSWKKNTGNQRDLLKHSELRSSTQTFWKIASIQHHFSNFLLYIIVLRIIMAKPEKTRRIHLSHLQPFENFN